MRCGGLNVRQQNLGKQKQQTVHKLRPNEVLKLWHDDSVGRVLDR